MKAVERTQATTLAGVPPLWVQLLEADWPAETAARLRRLTNSGGALTERLVRGLRSRFPQAELVAMYGLTEAFPVDMARPGADRCASRCDGPGDPLCRGGGGEGGRDARGRRAGRTRPRRAAGRAGLLARCGADRAALSSAPAWMASGGMAVWSGDTVLEGADGLLRFVGRDDEMIKSAGNRISPLEVEEAVLAGGERARRWRSACPIRAPGRRSWWCWRAIRRAKTPCARGCAGCCRASCSPRALRLARGIAAQRERQAGPGGDPGGDESMKPMGALPPEFAGQRGRLTIAGGLRTTGRRRRPSSSMTSASSRRGWRGSGRPSPTWICIMRSKPTPCPRCSTGSRRWSTGWTSRRGASWTRPWR